MYRNKMKSVVVAFGLCLGLSVALRLPSVVTQGILPLLISQNQPLSQTLSLQDYIYILGCLGQSSSLASTPEQYQTTDVLLQNWNYTVESHNVTTADGYILKVFRITGGPKSPPPAPGTTKKAVYLNHGMFGTSNQWLVQEGNNNLPLVLADQGFEVWLGNARGTSYSSGHVNLTTNDLAYWDFSWHEMAIYDVPAVVDTILSVSGNSQLYYVGYSMGTTQYTVALASVPGLNAKIRTGILLAPAEYIGNSTSPLRVASVVGLNIGGHYLTDPILGGKLNTNDALEKYLGTNAGVLCAANALNCGVCSTAMFAIFGFDTAEMNYAYLPSFYTNYADVCSTKTMVHYTQLMNNGLFRQFDYGLSGNLDKYNAIQPPAYNFSNINVSTVFFYGKGDNLVVPMDAAKTKNAFPASTVKEFNLVDPNNTNSLFNHLDFVIAKDVYSFIYQRVAYILSNDLYGQ